MLPGLHRVTHLVAHRGNAADYPENSLPAIRSARELGVRFVLLDVQLAADEVPIVGRDVTLARTAGVDISVFELAALCAEHPEITLLLELRRESLARHGAEVVVGRVQEVLRPVRTQCIVVSRDLGAVNLARERGGHRIGWILPAYDAHSRLKYEALKPEFLLVDAAELPAARVRLWRGPWRWIVLGVDGADQAQALAARGADFVATSAVAPLSAELRARARVP